MGIKKNCLNETFFSFEHPKQMFKDKKIFTILPGYFLCVSEPLYILSLYFCFAEFVKVIDKLFDETILIGSGWTTHESLR